MPDRTAKPHWVTTPRGLILKDGPHLLAEVFHGAGGIWIGVIWEERYLTSSGVRSRVMRRIRKEVSRAR